MRLLSRQFSPAAVLLMTSLAARAAVGSTTPPAPAPAAEPLIYIADFTEKIPGIFSYSTWKDRLATSPSGLVVQGAKGAQGNGGLGRKMEPALDFTHEVFAELALGVGVANEVPDVTIAFNDADGTQCAARVRIDQLVPQQPVWLRVRRSHFKRVNGQDGADGKMDWTQIAQWHLQGDWSTPKPFHVVFIALRTRH